MSMNDYVFPVGPDVAFKFGCGRFRMEEHLLERCAEEVLRFGRKPLFVCNDTTYEIGYEKVAGSLRAEGVEPKVLKYNGFCCRETALDFAKKGAVDGIDMVIGCGGGVVIDFSKCLADIAGVPLVTMPTSSATCCAFTPIAPCYTPEGRYISTSFFRREVAAALLDLTILAKQPARLLVAGACDAMAKKIEIEFWNALPGAVDNPVAVGIASLVADYIYADLDRKLDAAVEDLRAGEPTQTLRDVVFSSIVGAGVVSGVAVASVAGASVAGASVAGVSVSGASVAGVSVTGASVAGDSVAGTSVTGASVTGASVAGTSVAGASVAGASAAGALVSLLLPQAARLRTMATAISNAMNFFILFPPCWIVYFEQAPRGRSSQVGKRGFPRSHRAFP